MTRNDPFELGPMPFANPGPNPGLLALTLVEEAARGLGPVARARLGLRLLVRLLRAPLGQGSARTKMTAVDDLDAFLRRDVGLPEEAPRRGPPLYPPPPYF